MKIVLAQLINNIFHSDLLLLATWEQTFRFQGNLHSSRVFLLEYLEHRFIYRDEFSTDLSIILVLGQPALTQEVVPTNSSMFF